MGSGGIQRKPVHGKIVSVGRLDKMKSYNIYMVDVVKDLLQRGYKVSYDIYGEGPLREEIEEKIRISKLEKHIHLRGQMDYRETEITLSDAFVFVGMGTASIEASMCGVPSIVAIADATEPLTYGFLQDLPFGSCGEMLDRRPTLHISDIL
jgi:glycosyltransferase involved in cell wall biosynthesis